MASNSKTDSLASDKMKVSPAPMATTTYHCATCEFTSPTWGVFTKGLCDECWYKKDRAEFRAENQPVPPTTPSTGVAETKTAPKPKKAVKCGKCGQLGHYSTHHFKHENHPDLEAMRTAWTEKFENLCSRVATAEGEEKRALEAEGEAHLKLQKDLWSHRKLFHLDAK